MRTGNVRINVTNKQVNNQPDTLDLKGLDKIITDHVVSATLEMGFDNPWPVSGNLNLNLTQSVAKTVPLPGAISPPATQIRDGILHREWQQVDTSKYESFPAK